METEIQRNKNSVVCIPSYQGSRESYSNREANNFNNSNSNREAKRELSVELKGVNNDGNIQIVGVHWEPVDLHRLAVYLTSS